MKFLVTLLVTAVIVMSNAAPSTADIDVNPSKRKPSVLLDGSRVAKPDRRAGPILISNPNTSNGPAYESSTPCRIDPVVGNYGCRTPADADPDEPADDEPEVTPGDVLRAVRQIGLPALRVQVQPGTATLVNVPTIFYAQPQPFERSVELLGFDVDLVAEPVGYRWDHGDGTVSTTDTPGRPYPAMDVVHRYEEPTDAVRTRVDVTYRVRFRVDGGAWQTLAQPIVAAGPPTVLAVDEAAPVLTRP